MVIHRLRFSLVALFAMIVIGLAAIHTDASAQLSPCPSCTVEIQNESGKPTTSFPIDIALNYSSITGVPKQFTGPGTGFIPLNPAYGSVHSAVVMFPDGSSITVPFELTPPYHPQTHCYTDALLVYHCYQITCYIDESGCPHIFIYVSP